MNKLKVFSVLMACLSLTFLALGLVFFSCNDDSESTTTFTVNFNANGGNGTAPGSQKVQEGSSITLPDGNGLSMSDFTFGGWNTNASGSGTNYTAGSSYTPTGNTTLYAKWDDETIAAM